MADGKYPYSCFRCFPQFSHDYTGLVEVGIIKSVDNHYEWTKSKTSLAQYFKWIAGNEKYRIQGGFWNPIETTFWIKEKPIKRGSLSHNANRNGNEAKKECSKDFVKIKILLLKRKMNQTELAVHLGMTLQNLNNKLRRESFTAEELNAIAAALGASYSKKAWFTLNDTGEEI